MPINTTRAICKNTYRVLGSSINEVVGITECNAIFAGHVGITGITITSERASTTHVVPSPVYHNERKNLAIHVRIASLERPILGQTGR